MTDFSRRGRAPRIHPRRTPDLPSLTRQADSDECDINFIVENFRRTGQLPARAQLAKGVYGDFSSVDDFHSQANRLLAAQDAFNQLPSDVRKALDHDPEVLVAKYYSDDQADKELMIELGLVDEPETPPSKPSEPAPAEEPEPKPSDPS